MQFLYYQRSFYNFIFAILLEEHDMEGVMLPMKTVTPNTHPLDITSTLI
jgi:hypothetical protein